MAAPLQEQEEGVVESSWTQEVEVEVVEQEQQAQAGEEEGEAEER